MKKHHSEEQILGIPRKAELGKALPKLLRQRARHCDRHLLPLQKTDAAALS
jgi:hypothetical protein